MTYDAAQRPINGNHVSLQKKGDTPHTRVDDLPVSCRAPGRRCVDMRDCYTSKGCQYPPDEQDAP